MVAEPRLTSTMRRKRRRNRTQKQTAAVVTMYLLGRHHHLVAVKSIVFISIYDAVSVEDIRANDCNFVCMHTDCMPLQDAGREATTQSLQQDNRPRCDLASPVTSVTA